ncbi:MAG: hypothetical protein LBC74_01110 [Planctomycetaceae bacterium]|nr:hypothetical protein [Planctomycetaceae bacterium]
MKKEINDAEVNKIITTRPRNKNKINAKRLTDGISFFCLLVILLFIAGCSTISRCEPCAPVAGNSGWSTSEAKISLLGKIYGNKKQNSNTTSNNSASTKYNTQKNKSGSMSYLTIPPPPESPE